MVSGVNTRLFSILKKTAAGYSYLKSRTLVTSMSIQNTVVKSFIPCSNFCTSNCDEDSSDSESIYKNVNFEDITKGDPELTKKLNILMLQIENYRCNGKLIPKKITLPKLKHLLQLPSPTSRKKYLTFLAKNEFKNQGEKEKKIRERANFIKKMELINVPDHIDYSLGHNSLFMRIRPDSIVNSLNIKCHSSMLYTNDIVFDLSYGKYMTDREMIDCARQILLATTLNRDHINPLNVHFCNTPSEGKIKDCIDNFFGDSKLLETVQFHEESYLKVFDPKTLVYLSPHAKDELQEYNPDDVYIIGAYVDKNTSLPVSYGKAKADKIRSAKLPLDVHVKWKQGNKWLPLNIVYGIMLDLNYYRDMKKALVNNLPTRCYYKDYELEELYKLELEQQKQSSICNIESKLESQPYEDEELVNNFEGREFCMRKTSVT